MATAVLLYVAILCWAILDTWQTAEPAPSDTIIVLGAAVWGDRPSPALRERLDGASKLYHEGFAEHIIVTGGVSPGQKRELSEAAMSKKYLVERGIPDKAVILEDQSRNTMENLGNSKQVMAERGFRDAIIVTHGFHAHRAMLMAKKQGIPTTVEPVETSVLNTLYYTLRECAGVAAFQLQSLLGLFSRGV
jgi:uncharacterized SAM-binding protein YcdF (DUF218 family)